MSLPLLLLTLLVSSISGDQDDQVILITGGWNGVDVLNSSEVLGGSEGGCMVPDLPAARELHTAALTPEGRVLAIGGDVLSVLALDPAAQAWSEHSTLDTDRYFANVVSMPDGVYVLGGKEGDEGQSSSSSFLPAGSSEWGAGPRLPEGGLHSSCAVAISETKFLLIGGQPNTRQVIEYDTATGEWSPWAVLSHGRYGHSCATLGGKVVFSGGFDDAGSYTAATSIIDILREGPRETRERPGGEMTQPRVYFGMVALAGKIVAFGGDYGADYFDTVEEWDETSEEWAVTDGNMKAARTYFGSVLAPTSAVCGRS